MNKILRISYLFLGLVFFFIGEQVFSQDSKVTKRNLIAGVSADYPPFEFVKNGEVVGFDVELAHIIAKRLGYTLQIQDMKFASIISSVQTNRIDFGISSITSTPEREKNVDFSIKYYVPALAMIYRKKSSISSVEDLNEKVIAVQAGTTMESFLQEQLKNGKNFKLVSLNKIPVMIEELKMQRVDGVLIEKSQANIFVKKYNIMSYSVFESTNYGYAIVFKKGSSLRAEFNKVIKELKESGELNKLKQKWLTTK